MLRVLTGLVKVQPTFSRVIARAGLSRADVARLSGVSSRTIDALANPEASKRDGTTREITAWKVAKGIASHLGRDDEEIFDLLFEAVEE